MYYFSSDVCLSIWACMYKRSVFVIMNLYGCYNPQERPFKDTHIVRKLKFVHTDIGLLLHCFQAMEFIACNGM